MTGESSLTGIILETDSTAIAGRVTRPRAETVEVQINEQSAFTLTSNQERLLVVQGAVRTVHTNQICAAAQRSLALIAPIARALARLAAARRDTHVTGSMWRKCHVMY